MAAQPLGELWISLRRTEEELRDVGSRLNYQQQIIFEVIKQYGLEHDLDLLGKPQADTQG